MSVTRREILPSHPNIPAVYRVSAYPLGRASVHIWMQFYKTGKVYACVIVHVLVY